MTSLSQDGPQGRRDPRPQSAGSTERLLSRPASQADQGSPEHPPPMTGCHPLPVPVSEGPSCTGVLPRHHLLILLSDEGRGHVSAHLCAMQGGAHLSTQQRGRRSGGQGLLRHPLAGFLELMLNEVLQGGELCLAAATSVHVVLICKEPTVRGTGEGTLVLGTPSQGWHQNQAPTPGRTAHGRGQP